MRLSELRDYGLTLRRIAGLLGLSLAAAAFEGFGLSMFLPVAASVERGPEALAEQYPKLWEHLTAAYGLFGLPVNLGTMLGAVLLLMLLRVAFVYARQVYTVHVSQDVLHTTRCTVFAAYAAADYGLFDRVSTGHVINAATTEAARMGGYFTSAFQVLANALMVLGYLAVLMWLSGFMTLFAVVVLGVGGAAVMWFVRYTRRLSRRTTSSNMDFSFLMVERISAMRLLKLCAAGDRESARMRAASLGVRDNMFAIAKLNAGIDLVIEPFVVVAGLSMVYFASTVLRMSLAELGLFLVALLRLLPLAKELLRSRQAMQANSGSYDEVRGRLAEARAGAEIQGEGGKSFPATAPEIRFAGVTFSYPGAAQPALDAVDVTVPAGRTTALVGPSGAGKTTFVDLLPRLRRPEAGQVLFDGVPAEDFTLSSLRRGMAFVSQDASILNDTVRENLRFARPEAGDEEIWESLDKARAADFVRELPGGLDAVLGERGARLSGGQRQRLSLARALLSRAPVLVLDEPTSALDSETEQEVQKALSRIRAAGATTMLVIAHRLSTIRDADKIIVLSAGRVAEEGDHRRLAVSESWYARVMDMQSAAVHKPAHEPAREEGA